MLPTLRSLSLGPVWPNRTTNQKNRGGKMRKKREGGKREEKRRPETTLIPFLPSCQVDHHLPAGPGGDGEIREGGRGPPPPKTPPRGRGCATARWRRKRGGGEGEEKKKERITSSSLFLYPYHFFPPCRPDAGFHFSLHTQLRSSTRKNGKGKGGKEKKGGKEGKMGFVCQPSPLFIFLFFVWSVGDAGVVSTGEAGGEKEKGRGGGRGGEGGKKRKGSLFFVSFHFLPSPISLLAES